MAVLTTTYPPLDERPLKDTICLFDVDGPLTPARRVSLPGRRAHPMNHGTSYILTARAKRGTSNTC